MTSIFERALGADFAKLHPRMQHRFGLSSAESEAMIGRGVMERVWHGRPYTLPFLAVGAWRRIMFPSTGEQVPFTIENYIYVDGYGRETVTWIRTFDFPRASRRFDAYMIWSDKRACVVDYLGTHQHLAVDIHLSVDPKTRGLRLLSGEQRFFEGPVGFTFPALFSGVADVLEWYDEAADRFRISVDVANRRWGPLFGYRGSFEVEHTPCADVPARVKPRREEHRE